MDWAPFAGSCAASQLVLAGASAAAGGIWLGRRPRPAVGGALDSAPVPAGDGLRSPVEGVLAPPPAPNKDSFLQTLVVDARVAKVLGGGPVGRPCCTWWPQRRSRRSAPSPAGWRLPTGASTPVVGAPGRRGEGGVAARVAGPGASEQSAPLVRSAPWDLATASLRILVTMPLTGLLQRVIATCTFTFLPPANESLRALTAAPAWCLPSSSRRTSTLSARSWSSPCTWPSTSLSATTSSACRWRSLARLRRATRRQPTRAR